jgi:hypothetical protein
MYAFVSSGQGLIRCVDAAPFHVHASLCSTLCMHYTSSALACLSPRKTGIYNLNSPPLQAPQDTAPGGCPLLEALGYWRICGHSTGTRRVSRERRHWMISCVTARSAGRVKIPNLVKHASSRKRLCELACAESAREVREGNIRASWYSRGLMNKV